MQQGLITAVFLPVALGVIMLDLGLRSADFRAAGQRPMDRLRSQNNANRDVLV